MSLKSQLNLCHHCGKPLDVQSISCADRHRHGKIIMPLDRDGAIRILLDGEANAPMRLKASQIHYMQPQAARVWMRWILNLVLPIDGHHVRSAVWRLYSIFSNMTPDEGDLLCFIPGIPQARRTLPEFYSGVSLVFYSAELTDGRPPEDAPLHAYLAPQGAWQSNEGTDRICRWALIARPERQMALLWDDYIANRRRISPTVDVINLTKLRPGNHPDVIINNSSYVLAVGSMENMPL